MIGFWFDAPTAHPRERLANDGYELNLFLLDICNIVFQGELDTIALVAMIGRNLVYLKHSWTLLFKYLVLVNVYFRKNLVVL